MAKKFTDLRANMSSSAFEESEQQTQFMLTECEAFKADVSHKRHAYAVKQSDLASLLLQVKSQAPLAGDEMPNCS